jgi:hypothetical protein
MITLENFSINAYRTLADLVVVLHMAFILFAALGGLLAYKWLRVAWAHIPAALWAALIEFVGWECPLTPLENWLRRMGGETGYQTSFIEHYLLPVIYPASSTRSLHIVLGLLVLGVNLAIYGLIWRRQTSPRGRSGADNSI